MTTELDQPQALILENIKISLDSRELISISQTVAPGSVLSVMGPSGSGKSTLLAFIAGFLDPVFVVAGRALLGNADLCVLPAEKRRVGMLFQDPLLFPHMSVSQNLMFAIPQAIKGAARRQELVSQALMTAELEGFNERDPATLSGGQKARVALMRVLLADPGALLLDEPFSNLDAKLREQTRRFVFSEAKKRELPVLLVTHDAADAAAAGGSIFDLES